MKDLKRGVEPTAGAVDPGPRPLLGIHHITALASDPQRNVDFYTDVLGLRLVKQTVNFDAPDVYHLYYGDEIGRPGTILTFFPFPHAARGIKGTSEVSTVAFAVPTGARDYWIQRLSQRGIHIDGPFSRFDDEVISFEDPDGLVIELVLRPQTESSIVWPNGPVPVEYAVRRIHGATLVQSRLEPTGGLMTDTLGFPVYRSQGDRTRFLVGTGESQAMIDVVVDSTASPARTSAGSVHHIAWRVSGDSAQHKWQSRLSEAGTNVTEIVDRQYFRSIYFHEPGGILFEIATDVPGFLRDEPKESLGSTLRLPPWLASDRQQIERILPPIFVQHINTVIVPKEATIG